MKVYKCDSCGRIIESPHEERMKEFYIEATCEGFFVFPHNDKRKVKIHLCDDCFGGLQKIADKALKEQKGDFIGSANDVSTAFLRG